MLTGGGNVFVDEAVGEVRPVDALSVIEKVVSVRCRLSLITCSEAVVAS